MSKVSPIHLLDEVIKTRYIDKDFEFVIARYKNSSIFGITEIPQRIIDADINFEESTSYYTENWKYADFKKIALSLNPENYEQIRLGGFHCFDCVKKLALEIYQRNENTQIDTDLTEFFRHRVLRVNRDKSKQMQELIYEKNPEFVINSYNVEKTFRDITQHEDSLLLFNEGIAKTYKHPIFGMSKFIEQKRIELSRNQKPNNQTSQNQK